MGYKLPADLEENKMSEENILPPLPYTTIRRKEIPSYSRQKSAEIVRNNLGNILPKHSSSLSRIADSEVAAIIHKGKEIARTINARLQREKLNENRHSMIELKAEEPLDSGYQLRKKSPMLEKLEERISSEVNKLSDAEIEEIVSKTRRSLRSRSLSRGRDSNISNNNNNNNNNNNIVSRVTPDRSVLSKFLSQDNPEKNIQQNLTSEKLNGMNGRSTENVVKEKSENVEKVINNCSKPEKNVKDSKEKVIKNRETKDKGGTEKLKREKLVDKKVCEKKLTEFEKEKSVEKKLISKKVSENEMKIINSEREKDSFAASKSDQKSKESTIEKSNSSGKFGFLHSLEKKLGKLRGSNSASDSKRKSKSELKSQSSLDEGHHRPSKLNSAIRSLQKHASNGNYSDTETSLIQRAVSAEDFVAIGNQESGFKKAIRSLREQSLGPSKDVSFGTESSLLKRAISAEDFSSIKSRNSGKVSSLLGKFKKTFEPKRIETNKNLNSNSKSNIALYTGSRSDSASVSVDGSEKTPSVIKRERKPSHLREIRSKTIANECELFKEKNCVDGIVTKFSDDQNASQKATEHRKLETFLEEKGYKKISGDLKKAENEIKEKRKEMVGVKQDVLKHNETANSAYKSLDNKVNLPVHENPDFSAPSVVGISHSSKNKLKDELANAQFMLNSIDNKKRNISTNSKINSNNSVGYKENVSETNNNSKPTTQNRSYNFRDRDFDLPTLNFLESRNLPLNKNEVVCNGDVMTSSDIWNNHKTDDKLNDNLKFSNVRRFSSFSQVPDELSTLNSPDESESFDSWSVCSDLESRDFLFSPGPGEDFTESVSDRIRRKSFYSRFNDPKKTSRRKSSLTSLLDYRDQLQQNPSSLLKKSNHPTYQRSHSLQLPKRLEESYANINKKSPILTRSSKLGQSTQESLLQNSIKPSRSISLRNESHSQRTIESRGGNLNPSRRLSMPSFDGRSKTTMDKHPLHTSMYSRSRIPMTNSLHNPSSLRSVSEVEVKPNRYSKENRQSYIPRSASRTLESLSDSRLVKSMIEEDI